MATALIENYNYFFGTITLMNIMDMLHKKLNQTTKDFYALYEENKLLKLKIEQLQEKNDLLTRESQDLILTINSKLRKELPSE
jgi:FtsZ-binding cell division protein ZapB